MELTPKQRAAAARHWQRLQVTLHRADCAQPETRRPIRRGPHAESF